MHVSKVLCTVVLKDSALIEQKAKKKSGKMDICRTRVFGEMDQREPAKIMKCLIVMV